MLLYPPKNSKSHRFVAKFHEYHKFETLFAEHSVPYFLFAFLTRLRFDSLALDGNCGIDLAPVLREHASGIIVVLFQGLIHTARLVSIKGELDLFFLTIT